MFNKIIIALLSTQLISCIPEVTEDTTASISTPSISISTADTSKANKAGADASFSTTEFNYQNLSEKTKYIEIFGKAYTVAFTNGFSVSNFKLDSSSSSSTSSTSNALNYSVNNDFSCTGGGKYHMSGDGVISTSSSDLSGNISNNIVFTDCVESSNHIYGDVTTKMNFTGTKSDSSNSIINFNLLINGGLALSTGSETTGVTMPFSIKSTMKITTVNGRQSINQDNKFNIAGFGCDFVVVGGRVSTNTCGL